MKLTTQYHLMKKLLITTYFAALFTCVTVTAHASTIVTADNFNSYPVGPATFPTSQFFGTTSLVPDGSGGNAAQVTGITSTGGFYAPGLQWDPIVQPGPTGPNTSTNLADYTISFALTINSTYKPANGFELWISNGTEDGNPADGGSNLYPIDVSGFTTGVTQTLTFGMDANHFNPGQWGGDPFNPTAAVWHLQMDGIAFGSNAGDQLTYTMDNFQVSVVSAPEPSTYAMLLSSFALLAFLVRRKRGTV